MAPLKWLAVRGPVAAAVATMHEIGWCMPEPLAFVDHEQRRWSTEGIDLGDFTESARQSLEAKQWN